MMERAREAGAPAPSTDRVAISMNPAPHTAPDQNRIQKTDITDTIRLCAADHIPLRPSHAHPSALATIVGFEGGGEIVGFEEAAVAVSGLSRQETLLGRQDEVS